MDATVEEGGRWVMLGEAARALDCSVDTVRRRVKDGTLEGRKGPSRRGPAWWVRVDHAAPPPAERATAEARPDLVALLASLHAQVEALAERKGYLRARLEAA